MVLPLAIAALALLAASGAAAARDLEGWRVARWGMTNAALVESFGEALRRLPARQIYGGAYAELALPGVAIGGEPFTALFQMDEATGRLQQVLLRRDRRQPSERSRRAILAALREQYGRESLVCTVPKAGRGDLVVEHVWRFPTTTVHASFLDFYTSAMVFEDPNTDRSPLQPYYERRRNNPRFLPRVALVRLHPTERTDLMSRADCREP